MAEKRPYEIHWSKWPEYLKPDRERHFKRMGEKLVSRDVAERRYQEPEKYFAAMIRVAMKLLHGFTGKIVAECTDNRA